MYMEGLEQLLERAKTFSQMLVYNKQVVSPYLLSANGLTLSSRNHNGVPEMVAVCCSKQCNLVIEFDRLDGEEEMKDQICIAASDHDLQCPFNQKLPSNFNYSLFKQLGHTLFEERVANIQKHQKFIQLSPKEIKIALGLKDQISSSEMYEVNLTLEMFRKLDKRLNGQKLVKVKSIIFLAIFGWQFSQANQNEMICHFCGSVRNVFEFISPSQCTLMSLPNGFQFISCHRPWCCLIEKEHPIWRELLKQTVIHKLEGMTGQICKSEQEMKCKQIQDNAVKIYTNNYNRWASLKKRLDQFKNSMNLSHQQEEDARNIQTRQSFTRSIHQLEGIFDSCKETVETFVKRIKL